MQHTRTAADRHQSRRGEDDSVHWHVHAESMVITDGEEGMEQARVVQNHESILLTLLGPCKPSGLRR